MPDSVTIVPSLEKQNKFLQEYGGHNPVEIGILCEKYPALKRAWKQYKTLYKMCKESK